MADFKNLFDEEMNYLTLSGQDFAREYPSVAKYLNLDSIQDRDPYVERLFEGFAFLTARIRQQMEESDAGLAAELLNLVAADLLRPLPSVSVVQFQGRATLQSPLLLKKGQTISAGGSGPGKGCLFSLTRSLTVHPISLLKAGMTDASGEDLLSVVWTGPANFEKENVPKQIPVFLGGDSSAAWTLHYFLTNLVHEIRIYHSGQLVQVLNHSCQDPAATLEDSYQLDALGEISAFCGLRDFLVADQRFRFVELPLGDMPLTQIHQEIELRIAFKKAFPRHLSRQISQDNMHPFAVPVVNAFVQNTEPVDVDQRKEEYRIIPRNGKQQEILEVISVKGINQEDSSQIHHLESFGSFRHSGLTGQKGLYYKLRHERQRQGMRQTWISVGGSDGASFFPKEFLSIEALCFDGSVPRDTIQATDLHVSQDGIPDSVSFKGLVRPAPAFYPPNQEESLWKLLSWFMVMSGSLASRDALIEIGSLANWDRQSPRYALLQQLNQVHSQVHHTLFEGVPCPVVEIHLVMQDTNTVVDSYDRLAWYRVLGNQLQQLFIEKTGIGTLVQLKMSIEPCGLLMEWKPSMGGLPAV